MRILFLAHAFNSLAQRLYTELTQDGHEVSVEFDINDRVTEEAVALWRPELIVAPFLKRRIPDAVWQRHRCIVIHPGIVGDRGPSALDWAIAEGVAEWGVTAIEANGEFDAGAVWASVGFPLRVATKSSLYRNEVTEAAVQAVRLTLQRLAAGEQPQPQAALPASGQGRARPLMRQTDRTIDWARDDTVTVLRKVHAADGAPGVRDEVLGLPVFLHGAHPEGGSIARHATAAPGDVIGQRNGAILRATRDAAVWITHLRRADATEPAFKLPAAMVLGERLAGVPELSLTPDSVVNTPTWREIRYEEAGTVGWLHFPFHNGAMDTAQCQALTAALRSAKARPTRVIVLAGGPDFWSNGIHLNLIEAHPQPADESWRNINAMNDLVLEILLTDRQLTVAALAGNAGAGGCFLALAADHVWARRGVLLNPHYKSMGNLYGSEYWTYLLPRRVAPAAAHTLMHNRLPVGAAQAAALGLVDAALEGDHAAFHDAVASGAQALAVDPGWDATLQAKAQRRAADEAAKPLAAYRAEELERMKLNFYGFDSSYHVARHAFVAKVPRSRTPLWLAKHRVRSTLRD
ncbi:MAG: hydrogenase maturation protein [Rubrivivax sp.]|nr:hydrogenase maturation protein [Rubrivivax sp.]